MLFNHLITRLMNGAAIATAALALIIACRPAAAQCGTSIVGRYGGETNAVAQATGTGFNVLVVGRGTNLELYSLSNPNAPVPFSPPIRLGLDAPARKILTSPGSTRIFALLDNDDVLAANITPSPLGISQLAVIHRSYTSDIATDGQRVYISTDDEDYDQFYGSDVDIYDFASGTPQFVRWIDPFLQNYGIDRMVLVGSTLWLGLHEYQSSIFGIEGWNISNPSAPVRVTSSLNNAPLGTFTDVSAMTAIGNKLLISYLYDTPTQSAEDWLRAVDISTPANPVWYPPADLNGFAGCMSSTGNLLRISILGSGVGTWDTTNPASLAWLGAYFDSYPQVTQMIAGASTDYWAGGRGGLMTMNVSNPASPSIRASRIELPIGPSVVRQTGNTTVVLDYTLNTLRLFDYTLPEGSQLRSSVFLPLYSEYLELGMLNGGAQPLAIVATDAPGADSITIYDITNPAAPTTRATIPNVSAHLMSVMNSRLYVLTYSNELRVYELSSQPPALRSATPFGGNYYDFTCMTSWESGATKALALGSDPFGLWIINTTDATAPLVSSIWNPVSNYRVNAVTKGANFLYVSAHVEGTTPGSTVNTRLESLNVNNLASVTQRFVCDSTHGAGSPGVFDSLTYISAPNGKFLVCTQPDTFTGDPVDSQVRIYELPPGFFTGEGVPFLHLQMTLPYAAGGAAKNADGSRFIISAAKAGLYQFATAVQWAPDYGIQNFDQSVCYGANATFTAFPSGNPNTITMQWYRWGPSDPSSNASAWVTTPLTDGPTGWGSTITGSAGFTMTITNVHPLDRLFYYFLASTNSCGTTNSWSAVLRMCPGDFNCSGSVTVQDIFDFLTAYFGNDPRADFNGSGSITVQDLFDFLGAYFTFCF